MGILDHSRIFTSDRQARDYYKKLRWGRDGIKCEGCSSRDLFKLSDGRYECRDCHNRFTDFTGTYLSGIKLDFRQIAFMVYLFCLEQSARRASRELGVNYKTAHRLPNGGTVVRPYCQDTFGVKEV